MATASKTGREAKRIFSIVHDSFGEIRLQENETHGAFFGTSGRFLRFLQDIEKASLCDIPVLLLGESGSGKTSAARTIHSLSKRKSGEFFDVNVSAVSDGIIESELFGSCAGAFTDSMNRDGYFSKANGGSVFLDEIGDASLAMQKKLLKVVECGEFRKVGSSDTEKTDVRFLFATNADLRAKMKSGEFREDLFYRIAGAVIECPSLKEIRDDIPSFCDFHLKKSGCKKRLSSSALCALKEHDWPGNFRQLQNTLDRAVAFSEGDEIGESDIVIW